MLKVSLVITSKDRLEALKVFVESIRKHIPFVEMVVIDDASTDGTQEWLTKQKDITFLLNNQSVPVDEANNQGAQLASGEYLWFLNEDMEVFDDCVTKQIKFLEDKKAGSVAQKVYLPGREVQSRGHAFSGIHQVSVPGLDVAKVVDWSPFPFMRADVLKKIGGWSVHGQIYYGDTDLGLTLQKAGYQNWYYPQAIILHNTLGSKTGSHLDKERRAFNESVHQVEAKKSFMKKWGKWLENEHEDLF